jgi:hypothetical protein
MAIDPQKLNTIFNLLKDLIGEQGAFVLLVSKANGQFGEEAQVRTLGPHTRLMGLMNIYVPMVQQNLMDRLSDILQEKPQEPD